jgi:hypothetical protein
LPAKVDAMRKLIDAYYRLLNLLLVVTVAILSFRSTIQILSRQTASIPAVDLDRGDGALLLHLDDHDRLDGRHPRRRPLRRRPLARARAARQRAAARSSPTCSCW